MLDDRGSTRAGSDDGITAAHSCIVPRLPMAVFSTHEDEAMTQDDDAAAGVVLAQKALHARADGDDDALLAAVNGGSHAALAWATAYLVAAVDDASLVAHHGNRRKASRAMHSVANRLEDVVMARADVVVEEARRHLDE